MKCVKKATGSARGLRKERRKEKRVAPFSMGSKSVCEGCQVLWAEVSLGDGMGGEVPWDTGFHVIRKLYAAVCI